MSVDPLLYAHPVIQLAATALALWALALGWQRVRSLHLGQKASFKRSLHVKVGAAALIIFPLGFLGGLYMAWSHWHRVFVTDDHAWIGLAVALLSLWGLASGWVLKSRPAPRKLLPALHGAGNLVLAVLAVVQIFEGFEVIEQFLWRG